MSSGQSINHTDPGHIQRFSYILQITTRNFDGSNPDRLQVLTNCYRAICRAIFLLPGRGRVRPPGLAGISVLGPNSEPCGNNRSFPETCERARVPVQKFGLRDSIFGLVNSTYFFFNNKP